MALSVLSFFSVLVIIGLVIFGSIVAISSDDEKLKKGGYAMLGALVLFLPGLGMKSKQNSASRIFSILKRRCSFVCVFFPSLFLQRWFGTSHPLFIRCINKLKKNKIAIPVSPITYQHNAIHTKSKKTLANHFQLTKIEQKFRIRQCRKERRPCSQWNTTNKPIRITIFSSLSQAISTCFT